MVIFNSQKLHPVAVTEAIICWPQGEWVSDGVREARHLIWSFPKVAVSDCTVTQWFTSGTKWPSSGWFLLGCSHTCKWASANNEIFRSSIIRFFPSLWGRTTEADRERGKTSFRVLTSPEKPWSSLTTPHPPHLTPHAPHPPPHHISLLFFIYNRGEDLSGEQKKLWDYICFLIGCSEMVSVFGWLCEMVSTHFVCVCVCACVTLSCVTVRRNSTIAQVSRQAIPGKIDCVQQNCSYSCWKAQYSEYFQVII